MNTQNRHLQKALTQGYDLDFGKVIEKSFENFKKTWALGGLAFIIMTLVIGALALGGIFIVVGGAALSDMLNVEALEQMGNFNMTDLAPIWLFGYMIGVTLLTALSNLFYAGILKMIDDAEHNKNVAIDSLFHYFRSTYFVQLLLSGVILGVLATFVLFVFEFINLSWLGSLFQYAISFFTVLTIPLIIFSNQTAIDAIQNSMRLVLKNPLVILGLLIVAFLLAMIGLIAICIGIIFTLIFIYIVIYQIYISAVPRDDSSELDFIGTNDEE